MTPLRRWLKPPRMLLLILFLLTLVSVSAVGWFGWKLLEQEKFVDAQRSRERLEQAADRVAATVRGALAETGDRLGAWQTAPPSDLPPGEGLLLLFKDASLTSRPADGLLYYPFPAAEPEADPAVFADAELQEFAQGMPAQSLETYRRLAGSNTAAIRAGALLRMARVFRAAGRVEEARATYSRLAAIPGVSVAGVPADLLARHARCELECADAAELREDLLRGRWHLTRGQFEFYWSELSRSAPPEEALARSEATYRVWEERKRNPEARGQETLWIGAQPYLVLWRGTPERRAALLAHPESFLKQACVGREIACAVVDSEGKLVAGEKARASRAAVRASAETQLPWTLYVAAAQPLQDAGLLARQRFLLLGISMMVLFLVLGSYFVARAIRRETEMLRMQSDFVSAVSHEFRTPLTSLRQLTEILALNRVPSEERRQLYYQTLLKETTRLQRLIEGLLNFGRMEAGARPYRFEELDAAALAHRVVSEFELHVASRGRHIEWSGALSGCLIEADPDAISVALSNLLDNALKYSPDHPTVWVECGVRQQHVAITVRDKGPGIADSERKAIFRKFVRGSAATSTNAKGSGVGLAMVRYIVEAHGGNIRVESEPGQGSAFTMLLPVLGHA